MKIYFATGNQQKVREVKAILEGTGIVVEPFFTERVEIQADNLQDIAKFSLEMIKGKIPGPCFVEDAGLFINTLKGFPGPYSSYVFKTLGNQGILDLLKGKGDRQARFQSAIAFKQPDQDIKVISGETAGKIAADIRGAGWGFDPIFIPHDNQSKTYGEMSPEEKNEVSHRRKALEKFRQFLQAKT